MSAQEFCGPSTMRGRLALDFWSLIMAAALAIVGLVLVWPIVQVLLLGFFDPESQSVSFAGYLKVLTHPYYLGAVSYTHLDVYKRQDLGNPIYKGKISAGRPDKSGSAFIQLALILQIYGEEKGWDIYTKILDNSVLSSSSGAVSKFVNDGEAMIGLSNEDTLLRYKVGGGPVELLYPTDGTSAIADVMALTANPINAEGGKAFINFMLSKEAQEILDSVGRRPVRGDIVSKSALTPISKLCLLYTSRCV